MYEGNKVKLQNELKKLSEATIKLITVEDQKTTDNKNAESLHSKTGIVERK